MVLNSVLAGEVGDIGRVVYGLGAVSINGGVDKVFDPVFDGGVNQRLSLSFLNNRTLFVEGGHLGIVSNGLSIILHNTHLYAENTPNGQRRHLFGILKNGIRVIEVSLDNGNLW